MADSYRIDSNILLRISRRGDPDFPIVDAALDQLLRENTILHYTDQNVAEFWNVWTRPTHNNGFGLPTETAALEIAKFESMMKFLPSSAAVYERWLRLVRDYSVIGVHVHDARLVAAMLAHGIRNLLTLNVADFERYAGIIKVVHPGSLIGVSR